MQRETSAVIITDSRETMERVKTYLKETAVTAHDNIGDFSTDTRIEISDGFIINDEIDPDDFYNGLYEIVGDCGACFFTETDSNLDPYTNIRFHVDGETYEILIEGKEDTYIDDDIADWFDRWGLIITEEMAGKLNNLGIFGDFIIGDPADNEDRFFDEDYDDSDADYVGEEEYEDDLDLDLEDELFLQGTQYEGRIDRIERVCPGDEVSLVRENDNPYDKNAIDVRNMEGSLGHLEAEVAEKVAPVLDSGFYEYTATVRSVTPLSKRGKRCKTALISIHIEFWD